MSAHLNQPPGHLPELPPVESEGSEADGASGTVVVGVVTGMMIVRPSEVTVVDGIAGQENVSQFRSV